MSDEQREQGRDAGAPTAHRPDQHPAGAATPGPHERSDASTEHGPVPSGAGVYSSAPYGPQPHGAPYSAGPQYGSSPYGSPSSGSPSSGSPSSGSPSPQSSSSATSYGSPSYGSPSYGPQSYGATSYGQHTTPSPTPSSGGRAGGRRAGLIVGVAVLAGLVGGGAGLGGAYALLSSGGGSGAAVVRSAPSSDNASAIVPGSVTDAARIFTPSSVDIRVQLPQGQAEGSGVVLTADGNVLTNNHVVAGAQAIRVTLADGSQYDAQVVGESPSYDLAVIKLVGASGLTPATFGDSAALQVGQQVVAIGSPRGLTGTVTSGIVSAFDRTVAVRGEDGDPVIYNGLQTDTAINQGNSGGALVNLSGQVVGINSAILSSSEDSGSIGLGFAIPGNQAQRVAQEILNGGSATKPVLGVTGNAAAASTEGATVGTVSPDSPAAAAGLVPGDVITKVDDAPVADFADLVARIGSHAPADRVSLTLGSAGTARTVEVTLGSTPDTAASTASGGQGNPSSGGNGSGGGSGGGSSSGGGNPFGLPNPFGGGN